MARFLMCQFSHWTTHRALLFVCGVVVVGLMGMVYVSQFEPHDVSYNVATLSVEEMEVIWPKDKVVLLNQQTFAVSIAYPRYHDVFEVFWNVQDSDFAGALANTGDRYEALVDVSLWNWRKDHTYTVEFSVIDTRSEQIVATQSRVIYTDRVDVPQTLSTTVSDTVVIATPDVVVPVVVPRVLGKTTSTAFTTTWQPSQPSESQQFVISARGFDESKVSVFWATQDGHRNQILTRDRDGNYITAINFFGWRWKGDGPYEFSFGVIDTTTQTVLAHAPYELFWENDAITLQAGTVVVADSVSSDPSTVGQVVSSQQAPPRSAVQTESVPARGATQSPHTIADRVVLPSPRSVVDHSWVMQSLYVPKKPAVTASLTTVSPDVRSSLEAIMKQPSSVWLNGDSYEAQGFVTDILTEAQATQRVPVFVLYNIPYRDCGSYSAGGAEQAINYRNWVDSLAQQFGNQSFIAVIEPDALAMLNCLAPAQREERIVLISHAAKKLGELPNGAVYLDAGHPFWVSAEEMSQRLRQAGIQYARGFALNVSNFVATEYNHAYGNFLSSLTDGARYVVDTSRNGRGSHPDYHWCNPSDRGLGATPRLISDGSPLDGYIWIKFPGESDGTCNGGPSAGGWWPEYAHELYQNRVP